MKKLVVLLLACSTLVFGQVDGNNQRIIPLDSEIYPLIGMLTMESGISLLSCIKPYSEAEVDRILDMVNINDLSSAGKRAFGRINSLLKKDFLYKEDNFIVNADVDAALEVYLHTSDDESQWQYGYEDRLPLVLFPVESWVNRNFYGFFENGLKESRYRIIAQDAKGNYLGDLTSIPASYAEINYHYPLRAFMSLGGDNWNIQAGRDKLEFGNGESGNLVLSSYPDYYDFIKLKGFAKNLAFTWSYVNLESWANETTDDGIQRAFISHVLEGRIFDKLSIYFTESMLLNGLDPEMQFVNPFLIYHNLFIKKYSNSIASAGFNVILLPGLGFYGEYVMDQLQTAQEKDLYPGADATPNADGFLSGIKASTSIGQGFLSGNIEYVYTSPWLYIREGDMTFFWSHRELTDVLKSIVTIKKPLGYLYGPDAMVLSCKAEYNLPGTYKIGFGVDYILKGENTIDTVFEETGTAAMMKTPHGIAEKSLVVNVNGIWHVFPFLSLGTDLSVVNIMNYNHVVDAGFFDLQSVVSIIFKL